MSDEVSHGVVVVGGGLAGWSVVEAVRALDKDIPVALIASDTADRYHKPMLSVAISQGKTPKDLIRTTAQEAASMLNVRLLANTAVTGIDVHAKSVHIAGEQVAYDDLVLAIGACPVYPSVIGQDVAWHVNNLTKFAQLQSRLHAPKNIAIIGAGMIGTELAEDLVNAGHQVSLIGSSEYPLPNLLPSVAGERVLNAIRGIGVNWLGSHELQSVTSTKQGHQLVLMNVATGETVVLMVDEMIVATGLVVDEHLLMSAGLNFDRHTGIAVNPQTLQTSVAHIYAIGDCISIDGVPCRYVAPHRAQALAIASQILGQGGLYTHKTPMIRLKNKSINVTATGNPKGAGAWQVVNDSDKELVLQMVEQGETAATLTVKSV